VTLPAAPADDDRIPDITRRRLAPPGPRDGVVSWLVTVLVVAVAAVLRFAGLAHPPGKAFDEIYYARDAWGLLTKGVEWNYADDVPSYVVHPPLGKWLIALGEWLFGYYDADGEQRMAGHLIDTAPEFGWRFSVAVAGVLSVLLTVRIARRLFGSTLLGAAAGLLLAFDGFHLVLSRLALLDMFLLLFVLATFGALLLDRDSRRRSLLAGRPTRRDTPPGRHKTARPAAEPHPADAEGRDGQGRGPGDRAATGVTAVHGAATTEAAQADPGQAAGPGQPHLTDGNVGEVPVRRAAGVPWWRIVAAVLFACAVATKWSALFFLPAFALLVVWWEAGARRSAGHPRPWRDALRREVPWLAVCGGVILVVYLATWSGWFLTDHGFYRHWLADSGRSEPPVIGALWNLVHYHQEAFRFHSTLQTAHASQSWPWQWLLLGKPVTVYLAYPGGNWGEVPVSEVMLLGTPLLWWSFLPAIAATVWLGIARRDWRAGSILLVIAAGLLPWFWFAFDAHRVMYSFYTAPAVPFLVMAVVYTLGAVIGRPDAGPDRRMTGAVVAGAYTILVILNFAYFYNLFVGLPLDFADWSQRMWLGNRWHP